VALTRSCSVGQQPGLEATQITGSRPQKRWHQFVASPCVYCTDAFAAFQQIDIEDYSEENKPVLRLFGVTEVRWILR
jgi:hypothetical protein